MSERFSQTITCGVTAACSVFDIVLWLMGSKLVVLVIQK
jgi:hypothetical protein